jgi:uncharacterized surface protein with fasciclin (FAS1) repeats
MPLAIVGSAWPLLRWLLPAVLLLGLAAAARPVAAQTPQRDVVETAVAAGQFTTLARALQAAGLVDTLKGPGPFTVFAPTDAAFAKLPSGTLDALLADPERLRAVLTYHVVPGRVTAAQVQGLPGAATVQGARLTFAVSGGAVRVNDSATVTQADVLASNGVIHVIDSVLLPPAAAPAAAAPAATPAQLPRTGGPPLVLAALAGFGVAGLGAALALPRRQR